MRFAIVGCGDISGRYADRIAAIDGLELAGATDVATGRAEKLVAERGGTRYASLDALLADDQVDAVVNLTGALAHAQITRAALEAGKHVHTEKPLALTHADARELSDLAGARGLTLSCAPATLMGEAQQTAWKLVREGALGTVRVAYVGAGKQRGIELHGDDAMLHLASWAEFDSRLDLAADGESYAPVELVREPFAGIDWGRALVELRDAAAEHRAPRTSALHAAHVVEALEAIDRSPRDGGGAVDVTSEFEPPAPMEWAR